MPNIEKKPMERPNKFVLPSMSDRDLLSTREFWITVMMKGLVRGDDDVIKNACAWVSELTREMRFRTGKATSPLAL